MTSQWGMTIGVPGDNAHVYESWCHGVKYQHNVINNLQNMTINKNIHCGLNPSFLINETCKDFDILEKNQSSN